MAYSDLGFGSPNTQFFFDVNTNTLFKKDDRNYINALGIEQLNTLGNSSLLDIYLSTGNVVEPHYHQNACELVYCISGAAVVSILNPFSKQLLNIPIKPGQVANVPKAWWHYEIATVDNTHLLAIFDAPTPEVILGSDILRLTPANVWAHTYCLDEKMVKETLAPIKESVFIGPPASCAKRYATIQGYPVSYAYAGSQGYAGSPGYPSSSGYPGSLGYVGSPGYAGSIGNAGSPGNAGSWGNASPEGFAVPQGHETMHGYPQGYSQGNPQAYPSPDPSILNF